MQTETTRSLLMAGHIRRPGTWLRRLSAGALLALLGAGLNGAVAAQNTATPLVTAPSAAPLTVCMAEDNPPLSYRAGKEARGFDVMLAQALAEQLKRPLKLLWFESEYEKETSLTIEVNALLSSGLCSLASGFQLYAPDLGAPKAVSSRTPDYPGAKPKKLRPYVRLGSLVASEPYQASPLTLVQGPSVNAGNTAITQLADLKSARIGVTAGTLAGNALLMYRNGMLRNQVMSVSMREDTLALLESGKFDFAFVPINKFDAYRLSHPQSKLQSTGYLYPFRFNLGFVALEKDRDMIASVNQLLERAKRDGSMERWAEASHTSYVVPQEPALQPAFNLSRLRSE